MGFVGKMLKSAVVAKAAQVAVREMSKPENQRRAKELLGRVTKRGGAAGVTSGPTGSDARPVSRGRRP
jgi:hypothetical protein